MTSPLGSAFAGVTVGALLASALAGSVAVAGTAGSTTSAVDTLDRVRACVERSDGDVRVANYPRHHRCRRGEVALRWAVRGPRGATGAAGLTGPQGPPGPTGPAGGAGPKGDTGAQGDVGPMGDTGPKGATGAQGPAGPQGDPGPKGATGPAGPSGTVKVMPIAGQVSPITLPGGSGNTVITPNACVTPLHWAGPGESALLTLSATASPPEPLTDVLYVVPMVSSGFAAFKAVSLPGGPDAAESLQDGTANASVQAVVPLTAGLPYAFGVGVASNSEVEVSPGYCTGHVQIVRT